MDITLQDIARELNLSAATVSRSLRQDQLIRPETRARVNATALRMGYTRRSRRPEKEKAVPAQLTLGLLLRYKDYRRMQKDRNLVNMMAGIMAAVDLHHMRLQVHNLPGLDAGGMSSGDIPPMVQDGTCQAYIVHGNHHEEDLAFLVDRAPVVSMGRQFRHLPLDASVADNVGGMQDMVSHLVSMGHRQLAWVGAHYGSSFMTARQAGFVQGCLSEGLLVRPEHFFGPEIYVEKLPRNAASLLQALDSGVTALVCGNDAVAGGVIQVLQEHGVKVPQDVSVTGFDATENTHAGLRLTTVDPHFFEIGEAAAQLALLRLKSASGQARAVTVRSSLVPGGSSQER